MAAEDLPKGPTKTEFSLKPIETQLLGVVQQQMMALLTNTLSFIAVERLAYQVTQLTAFEIAPDMKSIKVWEQEPPKEPAPAQTETAKAVKQ
jgi:hypothetical protein